jgi:conjugal transfer pilus assembly protein TraV
MRNRSVIIATPSILVASALLTGGCAGTLSGVGGTSEYSCKAQPGVHCESVSGIYQNALQRNLPGQRPSPTRAPSPAPESKDPGEARAQMVALARPAQTSPAPGLTSQIGPKPLRSSARILRMWFKPWEDADHDLFDQGYLYIQVDGGRWMMDHVQRRAREEFASVRPPRATPGPSTAADPGGAAVAVPNRPRAPSPEMGQAGSLERLSALRERGPIPAPDSDE